MVTARTKQRAWEEAVRSLDIVPTPRARPDPLRWAWYAFWGRLPARNRIWVLYDATCSTWVLRHFVRLLTIAVVPVAAVLIFLPGPLHLRVLTAVVALLGGVLFAGIWVNESTEQRLAQAGWPPALGSETRRRRARLARWMTTVGKL